MWVQSGAKNGMTLHYRRVCQKFPQSSQASSAEHLARTATHCMGERSMSPMDQIGDSVLRLTIAPLFKSTSTVDKAAPCTWFLPNLEHQNIIIINEHQGIRDTCVVH